MGRREESFSYRSPARTPGESSEKNTREDKQWWKVEIFRRKWLPRTKSLQQGLGWRLGNPHQSDHTSYDFSRRGFWRRQRKLTKKWKSAVRRRRRRKKFFGYLSVPRQWHGYTNPWPHLLLWYLREYLNTKTPPSMPTVDKKRRNRHQTDKNIRPESSHNRLAARCPKAWWKERRFKGNRRRCQLTRKRGERSAHLWGYNLNVSQGQDNPAIPTSSNAWRVQDIILPLHRDKTLPLGRSPARTGLALPKMRKLGNVSWRSQRELVLGTWQTTIWNL